MAKRERHRLQNIERDMWTNIGRRTAECQLKQNGGGVVFSANNLQGQISRKEKFDGEKGRRKKTNEYRGEVFHGVKFWGDWLNLD